mmetsp:Transcript_10047/g.41674  ORF Transcript_10047/g.41674 Transcript_10047/m.41674 type:complete len:220 (-) Transcript_10047:1104-1763(-)
MSCLSAPVMRSSASPCRLTTLPSAPARPVRPARCKKSSAVLAISACTTMPTRPKSTPRATELVQTSTGSSPSTVVSGSSALAPSSSSSVRLVRARYASRSCARRAAGTSLWYAAAATPRAFRAAAAPSAERTVLQNTRTCSPDSTPCVTYFISSAMRVSSLTRTHSKSTPGSCLCAYCPVSHTVFGKAFMRMPPGALSDIAGMVAAANTCCREMAPRTR